MNNTIQSALFWAKETLVHCPSPRLDAALLLAHALDKNRVYLMTYPELALDNAQWIMFQNLVQERAQGKPVAYLLGEMAFFGRDFLVNAHTLVPRPETEELVEWVLAQTPTSVQRCIDLGTGSGVIAVTLALARPLWHLSAIDIDPGALAVAKNNAQRLGADRVTFFEQDGLLPVNKASQINSGADIIVANPPYIAENDPHLKGDGVCFEPLRALVSGVDGLSFIRRMIVEAKVLLSKEGLLFFEHGYDQSNQIALLLQEAGYQQIEHGMDVAGKSLFIKACWPGELQ